MKRYYYIYNGEPWNDELNTWWLAIEGALQTHMVKLHGAGVLEGLPVTENDPTPDMSVLIGAGYAWDGYGKIIHPTASEACDCSVDKNAASTIPSSGKERYIVIAAKHDRKLSGLETSIVGWPEAASEEVYTIDDDWYEYVVIAGAEADPGNATVPACQADEVHLAAVLLADSTTAIIDAMIDTSGRTTITNPADAIATHVVADPAHAAAKISVDDTNLKTNAGDVQTALEAQQTIHVDTGAADALVITPSPAITDYTAGQEFKVSVANDNTGACTININAKGAKAIKTADGNDPTPKALRTGAIATLIYDGTNFQMVGSEAPQIIEITPTAVLTGGQADTFTAVDCSPAVPAGTRFVIARLNSSSTHYAQVRRTGSSTQWGMLPKPSYAGDDGTPITIPVDSSRQFDYRRGGNPGTSSVSIDIVGYYK